jgi:hypothetical protein
MTWVLYLHGELSFFSLGPLREESLIFYQEVLPLEMIKPRKFPCCIFIEVNSASTEAKNECESQRERGHVIPQWPSHWGLITVVSTRGPQCKGKKIAFLEQQNHLRVVHFDPSVRWCVDTLLPRPVSSPCIQCGYSPFLLCTAGMANKPIKHEFHLALFLNIFEVV